MSYIVYKYCPTDLIIMQNEAKRAIELCNVDGSVKPAAFKDIMNSAPDHYIAINRWWERCLVIAKSYRNYKD
jgi:hypothetical protein